MYDDLAALEQRRSEDLCSFSNKDGGAVDAGGFLGVFFFHPPVFKEPRPLYDDWFGK